MEVALWRVKVIQNVFEGIQLASNRLFANMKLFNHLKASAKKWLLSVISLNDSTRVDDLCCAIERCDGCDYGEEKSIAYPLFSVMDYAHGRILNDSDEIENCSITEKITEAVDEEWKNSPSYPPPYIAEIDNVVVIAGSRTIVCDSMLALNDELETGFRKFNLQPKDFDIKISDGPVLHLGLERLDNSLIPSGIHLFNEHEGNYFHWVVEILPRLFAIEHFVADSTIPLLVSDGLHPNLYMLLDLLKKPGRPVCKLKKGVWYQVRRLIYPSDISRIFDTYERPPGTDTVYMPVGLLKKMAISIKEAHGNSCTHQGRRLFLRRGDTYRRLINEDEIIAQLEKCSFEIIDLNTLSVSGQISLFSQAEIVIGPSGAGFANIIWCSPKTVVVILHSDHPFKKYPYWDALGRVSDVNINYIAGPRANVVTGIFQAHDDYYIDPQKVMASINVLGMQS